MMSRLSRRGQLSGNETSSVAEECLEIFPKTSILYLCSLSLARKGLVLMGALATVACATTFPGLADLVFATGLEVLMLVIFKCVRDRVILRVP